MAIYVNIFLITIFVLFLVFNHDFVIYINFTHIAPSNIATDEVTNLVTDKIINTNL